MPVTPVTDSEQQIGSDKESIVCSKLETEQNGHGSEAVRRVEGYLSQRLTRHFTNNPDGSIATVTEADGSLSSYRYSGRGDLIGIMEPDGTETSYEYQDRLITLVRHSNGDETHYTYDAERLIARSRRGRTIRYAYDEQGRWTKANYPDGTEIQHTYDDQNRLIRAETDRIVTQYIYDATGQVAAILQQVDGVERICRFRYDDNGRLALLELPSKTSPTSVRYTWTDSNRPATVHLSTNNQKNNKENSQEIKQEIELARYEYDDKARATTLYLANGWREVTHADPIDCRPLSRQVVHQNSSSQDQLENQLKAPLLFCSRAYDDRNRLLSDDLYRYEYDERDRLTTAEEVETGTVRHYAYDKADRPLCQEAEERIRYDSSGQQIERIVNSTIWHYRYNDAGQLIQVDREGQCVSRFRYDHKGRLVLALQGQRSERYLYGPTDELLAVFDGEGTLLRANIPTPFGTLAEIEANGEIYFIHADDRGTRRALTDMHGMVIARYKCDPYGMPLSHQASNATSSESTVSDDSLSTSIFSGRLWFPNIGLYLFASRWYDPHRGCFLTPDTYTGAPDDERLVHPLVCNREQIERRRALLMDWLQHPEVRRGYAYCHGDPINKIDPDGHWAFGGALLSLLGAIWSLPNTLFGLMLEITCLIGEVIRWLVMLLSGGKTNWQPVGIEGIVTSSRLNAGAIVFSGGWIGSLPNMTAITFGNVIFVNKDWRSNPTINPPGDVTPTAYNGEVTIPGDQALYERELRRTNQFGWFGPFYHLGLPTFGFYLWDMLINGQDGAWLTADAHSHGGV